jgi:tripartite-type tricarboxylate transporter receptor subunit TctC
VVARIVGTRLSDALGQPVVIDNRPAAAGSAAAGMVARTPADGYTMMLAATSTLAVNPSMYKSLPYDSLRDFTYVANFVSMPNLLVVNPNVPAKSVSDLIALAKVEGGRLTYASAGIGSSNHFTAELFNYMAKVRMTHIPYKGGGPAMVDVAGGQVALVFATIVSAIPHVKAGRLRPLGVTSANRSPSMPDVLSPQHRRSPVSMRPQVVAACRLHLASRAPPTWTSSGILRSVRLRTSAA